MQNRLLMLIGFMSFHLAVYGQVDSLKNLYLSSISDSVSVRHLIAITSHYAEKSELDSAKFYGNLALSTAKDIPHPTLIGESQYALGYAYDLYGLLDTALIYYEDSRLSFESDGNAYDAAESMNAKGIAAYFAGDFDKSLEYYLEALDYTKEHGEDVVELKILINMAITYRQVDKNEEALSIYKKALPLAKGGDRELTGTLYHNIGVALNFLKKPEEALVYLDSAIVVYKELNINYEVGRSQIAKGETYYNTLKDFKNARIQFESGLPKLGEDTDRETLAKTYLLLAQIERDEKFYSKSKNYFDKGLSLIQGSDRDALLMEYYKELDSLYTLTGNHKQAHEYLKQYVSKLKSVQSSEKLEAIEELQTKYQTKEREQEIQLLNTQNELKDSQLSASRNTMIILSVGILLLGGFLYWLSRLNKEIKKSRDEKDVLLREIHHRVKNNLQVISALLTLQSSHLKDPGAKSALQEGQNRVESMALIHKDLYQHDNLTGVSTSEYLEQLVENLLESYKIAEDDIDLDLQIQDINLDVDTMIPLGLIVNELISNALKHAFEGIDNPRLRVQLTEIENILQLHVADNGTGVKDQDIFTSSSFGLSLIESFAKKLEADISFDHSDGFAVTMLIKNYIIKK